MLRPKSSIKLHNHNSTFLLDQVFHPPSANLKTITLNSLDSFLNRFGGYARKQDSQYHEFSLRLRNEMRSLFLDERKALQTYHDDIQSLVLKDPDILVPTLADHAEDFTITFHEPESWNGVRLLLIYDELFYRVHLTQCSDSWNYETNNDPYKAASRVRNDAGKVMRRYLSKCHKAVNQLYVDIKDGRTPVSWFELQTQQAAAKANSPENGAEIENTPASPGDGDKAATGISRVAS